MELLKNRDGLMLGICNGFQALIKLGLVPYGEIRETSETAPTLTFNTLGRHVSRMVYTRITSVKSPWFAEVKAGDVVTVPVSHGEGRFVADDATLAQLIENGPDCHAVCRSEWNALARSLGTEWLGLCNRRHHQPRRPRLRQDGPFRAERNDLYRNVPGEKDPRIFESGVAYFK